jgi:dTDP-4-dehydrorhamnose reductase
MRALEFWGGVECTVNRVGDRFFDQLHRSGHAARLDDLDRFAALGVTTLRAPLMWERLAPRDLAEVEWDWVDRYLGRIRDLGMRPIVGLVHHGSGPRYTSLLDERFPELLARYARAVAERHPWLAAWTPVNEPLTTARFSAMYGHWYPHGKDDRLFVRALLNQLRGIVLAMRAVRTINPHARLIQTEDIGTCYGTPPLHRQVRHERDRRWLTWDLLSGRVDAHHPLFGFLSAAGASARELALFVEEPCPPDIIGVNYYVTSDRWLDDRLALYPSAVHGGNGAMAYADVEAVRVREQGLVGHERHLVAAWKRYQCPVALTEVHLGSTREEQMRWMIEAWDGATRAREQGADVRAVTAWALLGSYDWDSLVTSESGHYEPGFFDLRAPTPRLTALGTAAQDLAAGRRPDHAVLASPGWWRRRSRLLTNAAGGRTPVSSHVSRPPILVVGLRGELSRGFGRVCAQRGLSVRMIGPAITSLSDSSRIETVLRILKPWAVIDAAGYRSIDQAETDRERCWQNNVTSPTNLARACERHGLPFVTFSTDLVFDGAQRRPYTEEHATAPLSFFGETKAEAEVRVLELLPRALVVRTGALFSPWDTSNFAATTLGSIVRGAPLRVADDCSMTPTYIPDLAHAVLDLLIDGERGVWHLANEGEVTWHQFARMLARQARLPESSIGTGKSAEIWRSALRPAYSALSSSRGHLLPQLQTAVAAYVAQAAVSDL